MPDLSHEVRHRAGRHQAAPKPGRVVAGLALPTAASVALMLGAAGAAVATSAKPHNGVFLQSPTAVTSPTSRTAETAAKHTHLLAQIENAQALAAARLLKEVERDRVAVARGVQRKQLAATAKRAALAHSWRLPITNPVTTSGFGYRWGRLHTGEDFAVSIGTPLASMSTGTVLYAGAESGLGNLVEVHYWDGTISYYGHVSVVTVSVGEPVGPGQIVGQSGNTGESTGPHLHLEIHPNGGEAVDPLPWLAAHHLLV